MDEKGRNIERVYDEVSETQELIIEMVKKIKKLDYLKRIYELVKYLYIYK